MKQKQNVISSKPFIKWAGGKGQLLSAIQKSYPTSLGTEIRRYAEPFVGGGAVLFDVLNQYELDDVYISDINKELIATYRAVRNHSEDLISLLSSYEKEYLSLSLELRKGYYTNNRNRFNELKARNSDQVELASHFIFLNKTCFNGLYRVNSKGQYNVPIGSHKNPTICDSENIEAASSKLQCVKHIEVADYSQSRSFVDKNTFVYFDPPYRPLNQSSSFTSYTELSFNDEDQIRLAGYVKELMTLGAKVSLSNSDPKNTDPNDTFFDDLYEGCVINRVEATRMINSKGTGRGKITELLITNYPLKDTVTLDSFSE